MKLKINGNYGQRDSRWASVLLGYNTSSQYSIGNYGCLITSLGNYIGKTPLEVNQILKDNGGFTAGSGNFIWSKSTSLGLAQIYTSPKYTGPVTSQGISKMKSLLDENRPLLTHVDFDPSDPDDDQHWILVYGYSEDTFFAFDPWSGTDITLDVYGGVERAVIEFKAYDRTLSRYEGDALSICLAQHTELVDKCNEKDRLIKERDENIREKDNELIEIRPLATEWKATASAYKVSNFTELDTFIRDLQTQLAGYQSSTNDNQVPTENNNTTTEEPEEPVKSEYISLLKIKDFELIKWK